MIIDIHAHTFPDEIAHRVITKLANEANTKNYVDGTVSDLIISSRAAGIDYTILQPVVTNPKQHESINRFAININDSCNSTGIMSFGGIHPDNHNYKEILNTLSSNGIKGIKLHPVFQKVCFDDIRYKRILDYASEKGMAILVHGGIDISFPGEDYVNINNILSVLKDVKPEKLILAHMGCWSDWDMVEKLLVGESIYFDTAFTIDPIVGVNNKIRSDVAPLSMEQFIRIVRSHGAERIIFGSDCPWSDQSASIERIKNSGLTPEECDFILGKNAARLIL